MRRWRAEDENRPAYQHDAPASDSITHLLALRACRPHLPLAGKYLIFSRAKYSLHDVRAVYRRTREKTNKDLDIDQHSSAGMSISVTRVCPVSHAALFSMCTVTGMRVAERRRLRSSAAPPTEIHWGQLPYFLTRARDSSSNIMYEDVCRGKRRLRRFIFVSLKQTLQSRENSNRVRIGGGIHSRSTKPEGAKVFCFLSAGLMSQ